MFLGLNITAWLPTVIILIMFGPMLITRLAASGMLIGSLATLIMSAILSSEVVEGLLLFHYLEKGVLIVVIAGLIHTATIKIVAYWPLGPPKTYSFVNKRFNRLVAFLKAYMRDTARFFTPIIKVAYDNQKINLALSCGILANSPVPKTHGAGNQSNKGKNGIGIGDLYSLSDLYLLSKNNVTGSIFLGSAFLFISIWFINGGYHAIGLCFCIAVVMIPIMAFVFATLRLKTNDADLSFNPTSLIGNLIHTLQPNFWSNKSKTHAWVYRCSRPTHVLMNIHDTTPYELFLNEGQKYASVFKGSSNNGVHDVHCRPDFHSSQSKATALSLEKIINRIGDSFTTQQFVKSMKKSYLLSSICAILTMPFHSDESNGLSGENLLT